MEVSSADAKTVTSWTRFEDAATWTSVCEAIPALLTPNASMYRDHTSAYVHKVLSAKDAPCVKVSPDFFSITTKLSINPFLFANDYVLRVECKTFEQTKGPETIIHLLPSCVSLTRLLTPNRYKWVREKPVRRERSVYRHRRQLHLQLQAWVHRRSLQGLRGLATSY